MPRKLGSKNKTVKSESSANPFVIASNLIEHNTRIFHLEKACSELGARVLELHKGCEILKTNADTNSAKIVTKFKEHQDRLDTLEKSVFEVEQPLVSTDGAADSN